MWAYSKHYFSHCQNRSPKNDVPRLGYPEQMRIVSLASNASDGRMTRKRVCCPDLDSNRGPSAPLYSTKIFHHKQYNGENLGTVMLTRSLPYFVCFGSELALQEAQLTRPWKYATSFAAGADKKGVENKISRDDETCELRSPFRFRIRTRSGSKQV